MADRLSQPFTIERHFDAPRPLVFAALTQAEHLQHWMGPAGMKITHCKVDLRPGGQFHYGLQVEGGSTMWGLWTFREIVAPERLVVVVQFSDEHGGLTRNPMAPLWPARTLSTTTLHEAGAGTLMRLTWCALDADDAGEALFDGAHDSMRQGWGGSMDTLAAYLRRVEGA
jgi:uncharacterized protein YndB with AHSA1/START domain